MKKIKILMPAYNSDQTIAMTLESLLKQTHQNFEIYVVDNCSSDMTRAVVEGMKDPRLHFLAHDKNTGNYGNFDRCLSLAGEDYSAIFHSDDLYEETILEEQVAILDSRPDVGAVFTEARQINIEGNHIGNIKVPFLLRVFAILEGVVFFNFETLVRGFFRYNCFLVCPTFMFRSSISLNEIHRTYPEFFDTAADVDVWMRIAQKWKVAVILRPLIRYRVSQFQHSFQINDKRTKRSDFVWIINFYTARFKSLMGFSRLDIKRTKLIDLILRFNAMEKDFKHYKRIKRVICINCLDVRLFSLARWWKYFFIFIRKVSSKYY